jgi:hypothetical protein
MPTTTFDKEYYKAFSVDENFFKRLTKLSDSELKAKVWLSDGSNIEDLSLDEVIQIPNLRSRQFTKMTIENPYKSSPRVKLTLTTEWFRPPVSYTITGDDRAAQAISVELDKLLDQSFQWHSPLSAPGPKLGPIYYGISGGLFVALVMIAVVTLAEGTIWSRYILGTDLFVLFLLLNAGRIRKSFFERGTFKLGEGIGRAEATVGRTRKIAEVVFVVLILGIVVHLFGTRLYDEFLQK